MCNVCILWKHISWYTCVIVMSIWWMGFHDPTGKCWWTTSKHMKHLITYLEAEYWKVCWYSISLPTLLVHLNLQMFPVSLRWAAKCSATIHLVYRSHLPLLQWCQWPSKKRLQLNVHFRLAACPPQTLIKRNPLYNSHHFKHSWRWYLKHPTKRDNISQHVHFCKGIFHPVDNPSSSIQDFSSNFWTASKVRHWFGLYT